MARKKKINKNIFIYIGLVLLILIGVYYSFTSFSVIDTDKEFYEGLTCETPDNCYDKLLDIGFPKSELDEQLLSYNLICENNICGVEPK